MRHSMRHGHVRIVAFPGENQHPEGELPEAIPDHRLHALSIATESSSQAQAVKPMAVSLCFGLMFATVLTLLVVPALFLLLNDLRRFVHWLRFGGAYPSPELIERRVDEPESGRAVDG